MTKQFADFKYIKNVNGGGSAPYAFHKAQSAEILVELFQWSQSLQNP
jgi:hypothetical protein